jgi:hypothetical protein
MCCTKWDGSVLSIRTSTAAVRNSVQRMLFLTEQHLSLLGHSRMIHLFYLWGRVFHYSLPVVLAVARENIVATLNVLAIADQPFSYIQ